MEEQAGFLLQRLCEAAFPGRGSGGDWRRQAEDGRAAKAEIPVEARERSRCIFLLSGTRGERRRGGARRRFYSLGGGA